MNDAKKSMIPARSLPPVVFDLITQHVCPDTLPSARLACKGFAHSVDHCLTSLHVTSWAFCSHRVTSLRLQHVSHMHAVISNTADWTQMQQLAQQLPKLQSIRFTGRRTWYKMDASTAQNTSALHAIPGKVQLPSLRAASFDGTVRGLADIAALAPQLEQLYCSRLSLIQPLATQLPHVTHFGSTMVHIDADGREEAAEAFAAAFPKLQVLFATPEFGYNLTNTGGIHTTIFPLREVLTCCHGVHSIRVFGSTTAMGGFIAQQLQQLQHIKRLTVYGIGPAVELKGMAKLTQLQHLRLSFELPAKRAATQLLQELAQLPQLQSLVLPAKLLCSRCCQGMQQALQALAGRRSSCKLVFLERTPNPRGFRQVGDYCPHSVVGSFNDFSAAAAAAALARMDVPETVLPDVALRQLDRGQEELNFAWGFALRSGCVETCNVWGCYGPDEDW